MPDKVRVGMLSFAHVHANGYANQVKADPEAELVVIWDEEAQRGQEAASKHGVPFEADLDTMLARSDIDGVVVNAPSSMHTDLYKRAAQAGKHIFSEKIFTLTVREADEAIAAIKQSGIVFVLSLPQRSRPETLLAKRLIDEGALGDITLMRARVGHNAALDNWWKPGNWFRDPARSGGGAFIDLGCHTVDIVRWLMGKPSSVMAKMTSLRDTYEVDDNSVALVQFENRGLAVLDVSWVQSGGSNPYEIYGSKGMLALGYPGSSAYISNAGMTPAEIAGLRNRNAWLSINTLPPADDMPFRQWVKAILHGETPRISLDDARNLTEMMEGCYRAAQEGCEVRFPIK